MMCLCVDLNTMYGNPLQGLERELAFYIRHTFISNMMCYRGNQMLRKGERGSTKFLPIYENNCCCRHTLISNMLGTRCSERSFQWEKGLCTELVCLIRTPYIGTCRPGHTQALSGLFSIVHTHITRTGHEDPLCSSLVPRLPRSGTRTLKLYRRGEPGIFCRVKSAKGREEVERT